MEDGISNLISELTRVITELGDRRTGDAATQDNPGMLGKAFNKSESQKKSEDNKDLAEKIAEQNAEQSRQMEEEKGRKILQSVTPMNIVGIDKTALKQLKSVMTTPTDTKKMSVDESEGGDWGWIGGFLGVLGSIGAAIMPMLGTGFMAVITGIGTAISTVVGILAGPVGLILLAIAGLSAFFVGFWEEWQESGDIGAAFESGMEKVFDWLIAFPATLVKDLIAWGMRKLGFEEEAAALDENWDKILAFGKEIYMAPYRIIVGVFDNIWGGITQIWDGVKNIFAGIGALLSGDTEEAGKLFSEGFGDIFNGLWSYIYAIPSAILNWFMELFGFKSEDDPDIDLGDMLWKTVNEIFDWFKLLFTSPEEAFKKIGDWFDKLFEDPVGAFKDIMPAWLVDFGVWVYDHTIGPIVELWNTILGDPEGSKESFLNLMPDWLRDIASWVWDRTIGPAVELWNKVFGHPDGAKAGFKSLFPEWLWNIMEWIYDHTIGPVVSLFTDLFDGKDTEDTFRKYLPDWMIDTFLWIKTNVFGGITDFFGKLFEGDVDGALRAILPDWLVDGLMWVVDNVFGPITTFWTKLFEGDIEDAFRAILPDWLVDAGKWIVDNVFGGITEFFGKLFEGDIIGAFKAILPDWLLDIFGWLSKTIFGPIGDWFGGIWDKISDVGAMAKQKLKSEFPKMYDFFYGDEEEAAAANKKKKESMAKAMAGSGIDPEMAKMIGDQVAAASASAGGDNYENEVEKFTEDIWDIIESGDTTDPQKFLDNLNAKGTGKGTASYAFYDYLKKSGVDTTNKEAVLGYAKHFSSQFKAGTFNDTVTDEGTARLQGAGFQYAELLKKEAQYDAAVDAVSKIFGTTGITIAGERINLKMLKAGFQVTEAMQAQLKTMQQQAAAEEAAYKGGNAHPGANAVLMRVFDQYGLTKYINEAKDVLTMEDMESAEKPESPATPVVTSKPLSDFIMRPGMDPVAFDKGDILLGIHKDNPPATTTDSPELINRVDQMVNTLRENKDIQAKMLQALVESGLMDKQGNTVVNSGGNSTVVNNTTVESDIMSFRDRVVGRINNSTTKY